ncbi:MAG: J domain-containing protein [bacterium]|nr:J domain-containing protein [bacterium]
MMGMGFNEFLLMVAVVVMLSAAGVWPQVMRALRELRGESVPDDEPAPKGKPISSQELDVCFKMLGVSPSAPWEEVERAYRKKAKLHHPDRGGDDDTMRALNEAYSQIKRVRNSR